MTPFNFLSARKFKHDKTVKALTQDVIKAKSKCEYVKRILEPKIIELIKSYGYRDDQDKLIDNLDTFLAFFYDENADKGFSHGDKIDTLLNDLHKLSIDNGFEVEYLTSPILLAEYELIKAESALINYTLNIKNRNKFISLI